MENELSKKERSVLEKIGCFGPITTREVAKRNRLSPQVASRILGSIARKKVLKRLGGKAGAKEWLRTKIYLPDVL